MKSLPRKVGTVLGSTLMTAALLSSGVAYAASYDKGWQKSGNDWYYLEASGAKATGWKYVDNHWYYLEPSGVMATGWKSVNGKWYYLEVSGAMATGWKYVNNNWYYLEPSGAMAIGWKQVNGKWYYLESSGAMATGWKYVNNNWYYLEPSGAMATGWKLVNEKWYYLEADGAMATGWLKLESAWAENESDWYYLNADGSMHIGCLELNGKMYYMDPSGRLSNGPFDVIYEPGVYAASTAKQQAAEEAARIVISDWDKYGWIGGNKIPEPTVEDISTLHVGKAIPVLSFMDGKLVYSNNDLYPVICDGKIITSIMMSTEDTSDRAGGLPVAPTESVKESGYLSGPGVRVYDLENHLDVLRQGCALVRNWGYMPGALMNNQSVELLEDDPEVPSSDGKTMFERMKDLMAQVPDTLLVSEPLEL